MSRFYVNGGIQASEEAVLRNGERVSVRIQKKTKPSVPPEWMVVVFDPTKLYIGL